MNIKCQGTVLITGAANGIGYQLARIFAHNNYNLVLVDRVGEKLTKIAVDFACVHVGIWGFLGNPFNLYFFIPPLFLHMKHQT